MEHLIPVDVPRSSGAPPSDVAPRRSPRIERRGLAPMFASGVGSNAGAISDTAASGRALREVCELPVTPAPAEPGLASSSRRVA